MEEQLEVKIKTFLEVRNVWKDFLDEKFGDIENSTLIQVSISSIDNISKSSCNCIIEIEYNLYDEGDRNISFNANAKFKNEVIIEVKKV
jgi:hypothetical protein